MSKKSSDISDKISTYLQIIIFAVLALAFIALIFGIEAYLMGNQTVAIYLILIPKENRSVSSRAYATPTARSLAEKKRPVPS